MCKPLPLLTLIGVFLLFGCDDRPRDSRDWSRERAGREKRGTAGRLAESRTIPYSGQTALRVEVEYAGGYLDLEADTSGSLAAVELTYANEDDRPEILFDSTSARPTVRIRNLQRHRENLGLDELRANRWHLRLAPQPVLDLQVDAGAVDASLDFTGLRVQELRVNVGAGEIDVAFRQPNPERARLRLDAGAAATTATGLGYANFSWLRFDGGAGKSDLSFDGPYVGEGRVDLHFGVGFNTVRLARDLGARIEKSGSFLAPMSMRGFEKRGNSHYSKNYDAAVGRLDFDIAMGVGHTSIQWID